MEGESNFQSINDALQSIIPDIITPTAHPNNISVIAKGTPAYCIHQIFTKALPESLLEIYLRDFKLAQYHGSFLYDNSILALHLKAHYGRDEWMNFWSKKKNIYKIKLQKQKAQYNQSFASSAVATTCNQHISGKENNIMEGSRQGTTLIDLTLADDESVETVAETSMQDIGGSNEMLGMHGVKDDNGAGGGSFDSLNYSYSSSASNCDMSISYDGSTNLETSTLFLNCPECLSKWEEGTYCRACGFEADEDTVTEKDFKKEEWKLASRINVGSFFQVFVGNNANTSSELYMSLITYFARIVNLIIIHVFFSINLNW